jgi:hypothetical protein
VSGAEQHQWAVAQTLGFAQEAAAKGDFHDALQWLGVVETADEVLPAGWEPTPALWPARRKICCWGSRAGGCSS